MRSSSGTGISRGFEPVAPEPAPPPEVHSLAETPAPELPKAYRARAEQQRRVRRAATHGVVWAGLASAFIGLIASAFLFRVEVVQAFPRAAAAYAAVGTPVNPIGLDFEAMSAREVPNHPGMVLVSGALRNVRDAEIVAPPVRVALLDEHGAEVGFKVIRIEAAPVLPGKVQGFAVMIPDPGGHGADIGVNFVAGPEGRGQGSAKPADHAAPAKPAGHGGDHAAPAHDPAHGPAPAASDAHPPAPHAVPAAHGAVTTAADTPSNGLRSAVAPGLGGRGDGAPLEARPIPVVDMGRREAVSASHHG